MLATIAVPIVIYGLMPHLHRARRNLISGLVARTDHVGDVVALVSS